MIHEWARSDYGVRRWLCTRCGHRTVNRSLHGLPSLCKAGDQPPSPTYDALEAEVTALRQIMAEFA